MIQIPLEIGDTILAGRFKNKKITVKEISYDEYGSPTVNGRSILKIRIPKLYQKQENSMKLKESTNLFSKQTNVKIKQENKRWHIYLETVDGDECLTPVGYETKEQAEYAAMMKGYNFKGNPYSEDYEGLEVDKPSKREATKGTDKPEEMKLGKEKEIKLEGMIKRAIREISKKQVKLKENVDKQKIRKQIEDYIQKTWKKKPYKGQIRFRGDLLVIDNVENDFGNYASFIASAATGKKWDHVSASIAKLKESFKLKEVFIDDPELESKIDEMGQLHDEIDQIKARLEQLTKRYDPLNKELTQIMEQYDALGEKAIETKNILITIKRRGNPSAEVAAYKERFLQLYNSVNRQMKKKSDEWWEKERKFKSIPSLLAIQKKTKSEGFLKEESWLSKIKNWFSKTYNSLFTANQEIDKNLLQMKAIVNKISNE